MTPGSLPGVRPLLGRESLLAMATARLADLDAGRGAALLLTGEPGIGKTRLAEEVDALARERGYRTAWATAWQGEGAPPLWPWVQILRQLSGTEEMLSQFEAESPAASPAACFAQSEAISAVVRSVSFRGPLVVVLDDLQWADAASIRVLCAVASAVRDVGCLLIGTYRPEELGLEHIAELARVGVTLAVPRLSDEAASALLRSAAGDLVSAGATGTVIERSAGNPLFVWEFGQLMAQSGRVDVAPAAVPEAVAAVIERRLARLSEPAVETLRAGAIAGNPFSVETVARIGGMTFAEASDGLEAAVVVGFMARVDDEAGFRFSHDVVRDVVLSGIDSARRAELHLRAAAVFEERLTVDPSLHAVVADHLDLVGLGHEEAAAAHWEQAAHTARRVLAFDEAARCLAHAGRGASDPRQRAALLVEEGGCLLLAGDLEAARARFMQGAEVARRIHAPETMARAVLGIGAGPVAWEVPIASAEQAALVADALELLPDGAAELRSMLLARLSVTAATPETMATARQRATDALGLAQQVADPALIAQALAAVNDAFGGPAHTMTRRDNADTIVELAVQCGDRVLELVGYRFRIVADLEVGDVAAVDRSIAAFTRLAEQLRQPLVSWYVPLFRGMRSLLAGELDSADRYERAVAAAAEATGSHNAQMLAATLRLGIDVARGRPTDSGGFDELFDVDPAEWASYAAGLAMMKLHGGDPDRARELLKLHADNDFVHLGEDGEQLTTLVMFGRVAVALDELAAAGRVYDLLSPHAGLWAVDGIAACTWGPVDLELGRIAFALGHPREARAHLEQARDSAERVGARLFAHDATALERQCGRAPQSPTSAGPAEAAEAAAVFRRDGQFWTLSFRGRTVRMKDAKGLHDLARLVSEPAREVHVLDLAAARSDPTGPTVSGVGDLGELLDTRARAEYRRRLAELEDEVADAERCNDLARAERAGAERDFIASELAAALGLDGRPRRAGDNAERARKAVTARIRLTIGRIDREHPDLGRHLANSVRTGTTCSYRPETPTQWVV